MKKRMRKKKKMLDTRLRELFEDWVDWDIAEHNLAVVLGIIDPETPMLDVKHIFWTSNPWGEVLHTILTELVYLGVLEYDVDEVRYRWNTGFETK